ncbi:MAG: acyl-CoA mutase large subunit family protein [Dehalococcoidia bacterium]|nr:acyl-CoA mutase large subunit family protein [Dehalococcoidia bacterium]
MTGKTKAGDIVYNRSLGEMVRDETQGGLPLKVRYTPEDIKDVDYDRDLGDPGCFPFTRGIYPQMYRNKLWIKSFIVSYSTPEETNQAFKEYIAGGQTGLRLLADLPIQAGIDPDHPSSWNSMLCGGVSSYALDTYERMLQDLPLENVDYEMAHMSVGSSLCFYSYLVALMEKQGLNIASLRGSSINDPFRAKIVYDSPDFPTEIARRVCLDLIEFGVKNTPKFKAYAPNGVDPEQSGLLASQELAGCLGVATAVYTDLIKERGLTLDEIGPTVFSLDAESDFFETIAKFRAARRMWAKIARDKLGAKTSRAQSLRIGIRTSGISLQTQKPLNNAARVTLEILSCVLGGVNSLDASSIDEAIGLPSREVRLFNLDAQHIITHEANIPLVADPLGGSYYVEWLTNKVEEGANEVLNNIEKKGGMWACLESGWLRQQIDMSRMKVQSEINNGKRLLVGVNAFRGEEGPINKAIERTSYRVPSKRLRLHTISDIKKLKKSRDQEKMKQTVSDLYNATKSGQNVVRASIEAAKARVTVGETIGVIRLAYGCGYDPLNQIETPDYINEAIRG